MPLETPNAGKAPDADVPAAVAACTDQQLALLEQSMTDTLTKASADFDFTLMLESADGRSYRHSEGASTGASLYESASTSKLVTAVVILWLVDRDLLTLDSQPQDFISFWAPEPANPASEMTLRHLLSFTSGFMTEPPLEMTPCLRNNTFEGCVQRIYELNVGNNIQPGSEFYYSSTHLQIAGLMAIEAGGYDGWAELFDDFKSQTGLFGHSAYNLPSPENPRLAGGMTWTGEDYLGFLRALYAGEVLSPATRSELWADQRGTATVAYSPALAGLGEDWHYALGNWVESETSTVYVPVGRNSSPGAYGAYPFMDFQNDYFGILATQDTIFQNGIALFRTVQATAAKWATKSCTEYKVYGFFLLATGAFFLHGFMHLGQAVPLRRYVPAVVSSALIAIPYGLILYWRLIREGIVDVPGLLIYFLVAIVLTIPFILVMHKLGEYLYKTAMRFLALDPR
ncbi:MAG: serine hydrolase [Anaerolineae bacterium]|nr:serine hydrolase [Anaerolineae bacterium]